MKQKFVVYPSRILTKMNTKNLNNENLNVLNITKDHIEIFDKKTSKTKILSNPMKKSEDFEISISDVL